MWGRMRGRRRGRRSGLWSAEYAPDLKNLNEMQKKLEDCAYLRAAVERDDWRAAKNHVEHFPVRTPENAQRFYQAPLKPEDEMTVRANREKRMDMAREEMERREMERRDMVGREIVTGGSKRRRQSRKRLSKKARARNVKKTNRKLKKRGKTHRKR